MDQGDVPLWCRIVCSIQIGLFSLLGVLSTIYVIGFTLSRPTSTTFNYICLARCFGNLTALLLYLCWQTPSTIMGENFLPEFPNRLLASIIVCIYTNNQFLGLLQAFNRFVALFFFESYGKLCTFHVTGIVLLLICVVRGPGGMYFTMTDPCKMIYDGHQMTWSVDVAACKSFEVAQIMSYSMSFLEIVGTLPTILRLLVIYRKNPKTNKLDPPNCPATAKKTNKLFIQTFLQVGLFVMDMMFMSLWTLIDHPLWRFFCLTQSGLLVHSLDSVIAILCQPGLMEFRKNKRAFKSYFGIK